MTESSKYVQRGREYIANLDRIQQKAVGPERMLRAALNRVDTLEAQNEELRRELEMYRTADDALESVSKSAGLPWRAQLHDKARRPEEGGPGYPFDTMSIWADKQRDGITRRYDVVAMWGIAANDAHLIVTAVNAYPKLVQRVRELTELAYRYRRPGYEPETYQDMAHSLANVNGQMLQDLEALKSLIRFGIKEADEDHYAPISRWIGKEYREILAAAEKVGRASAPKDEG